MSKILGISEFLEGSVNWVFGEYDLDGDMAICRSEMAAAMLVECVF